MSLVDILNELGEEANQKISSLNWGGCCVFAGLVADALDEKGYPVQGRVGALVAGLPRSPTITEARKKVRSNTVLEWNKQGIQFGHVGIEFYDGEKVYLYDSNGCVSPDDLLDGLHSFEGRLTVKELNDLWEYNGPTEKYSISWNSCFDRNDIPDLRALVRKHFIRVPFAA